MSEFEEDAAQTISSARSFIHWLDEIHANFEKSGGFENPGKGKPLQVQTGDPLTGILSHAHVLPAWLELQHNIRDKIHDLMMQLESAPPGDFDRKLEEINGMIKKYNAQVPVHFLQKSILYKATIKDQYERWL